MMSTDCTELFANAVAGVRYEDLPSAAIDAAKGSLLDTLGVMLAASGMEPAVRPVIDLVMESGGASESSLLGSGVRVPATGAALANGAMAHCLDFDDRTPLGRHCGSSLIPAALALAEKRGGVSGRAFIAAIAAGQDLFVRLRHNVSADEGWNLSTVLGILSATAAASSVLALDAERTSDALGIASMQASGTMQLVNSGSALRGMYAGFAAQSAVTAALLAQKGLRGIAGALDGEAGLFTLCFRDGYDRHAMLDGLGTTYLGSQIGYKPWPVVGLAHPYIHATLELRRQHRIAASDIDRLLVFIGDRQRHTCAPLARRRAPQNAMDAKFSLPYCIALAAVHGDVSIAHFKEEALAEPAVRAFAEKVTPVDSAADAAQQNHVRAITRDGRILDQAAYQVPGSPSAPMTWPDLVRKFVGCASVAAAAPDARRVERTVERISNLEDLDDVSDVVRGLV